MVPGNGRPSSGCMDLLTDRQYGSEVGAQLLCYTCQSVDTNGAKAKRALSAEAQSTMAWHTSRITCLLHNGTVQRKLCAGAE